MTAIASLPVAVIGAGPVGLAAAAHLDARGIDFVLLEGGPGVGTSLREWGHVRVFSPWEYNIDPAARSLLQGSGWTAPDPRGLPTGSTLVRDYLEPLGRHPAIAPHLVFDAKVTGITREGLGKLSSSGRGDAPFLIRWADATGTEHRLRARVVIDASGTWRQPNPIGVDGLTVPGEAEAADRIAYGIPDVLGRDRAAYAGKSVLVIGGGHSAINAVLDLLRLQEREGATRVKWALRRRRADHLLGGGLNDRLPERGALGLAAMRAIDEKRMEMRAPFAVQRIERTSGGLRVHARHGDRDVEIGTDRIVVATGQRPELGFLRELRVALDPAVEAPPALAPLIDPNLHSCGTVPPHGAAELAHPEPGLYIAGSKSYGRAPTFLMATGYEQVRSIVAEIAGDHAAAREVRLVLPETGVCSTDRLGGEAGLPISCCGGPAPADAHACSAEDAAVKALEGRGCGCGTPSAREAVPSAPRC